VELVKRKRRLLTEGWLTPVIPSIALQKIGGAWFVVEDNTSSPDGYFVMQGGQLVIDEGATSGLPISLSGPLLVGS
jgi:hypothetical protein